MRFLTYTLIVLFTIAPLISEEVLQLGGINLPVPGDHGVQNASADLDLPESDASGTDIIRFTNGDLLHGKFVRFGKRVIWSRPDLDREIDFKVLNVSQIVFDGGRSKQNSPIQSFVTLINGDQIPGEIISLDHEKLVLKSPFTSELKIPRNTIVSLTTNPFDGKLNYAGPFTSDGWVMMESKKTEPRKRTAKKKIKAADDVEVKEEEQPQPSWLYSGASFYSTNIQPLVFDAGLPEVGRLKFKAAWKNRLQFNLAFHADFTRPLPRELIEDEETEKDEGKELAPKEGEQPPEEKKPEYKPLKYESLFDQIDGEKLQSHEWLPENSSGISHAQAYGSSYVLSISGYYPTLTSCTFDDKGNMKTTSQRSTRVTVNTNLQNEGEAEFEIRFNRPKSKVYLFINGEYAFQWNDLAGYAGKGGGIAFAALNNCKLKISDITATSWNGAIDSAMSLSHEERDVALLTNGTDRFSGEIMKIVAGKAHFNGRFSEMEIPLEDLSELHFKTGAHQDPDQLKWGKQVGRVLFNPIGRLTLSPSASQDQNLLGESPILGKIKIDLTSAVLLDFADDSDLLNEWITDF